MKQIVVINTGGTFASRQTGNGLAPQISASELESLLGVQEDVSLSIEDYCFLDSSNIGPRDWQAMARRVFELRESCDGIILIHGTDTMAYTASMLCFMLKNLPVPLVLTGSQLPIGYSMSDAADNFQMAVQMVISGCPGIFLAFNRRVSLGCRSSKVRTVSFDAFESINYPYVARVDAFGFHVDQSAVPALDGKCALRDQYSDKIAVLKLFPGMQPDIFRFLEDKGYEGAYIEGFGLGGVPFLENDFTAEIRQASDRGFPVLVGSQCRYEGSNLNIYETGRRVLDCGGIPVHDMTQEAVVTKLMWALGQSRGRDRVCEFFKTSLYHEITLPG